MNESPIIEIKDVSYRYDRENVLEDIHLSIPKGAFLGLVGPNGSGKSTLLKLILGLLKVKEGEVLLFHTPQKQFKHWERIGFVSQKANSFNTGFPATVYEVVSSGLTKKLGLFRLPGKKEKQRVYEALQAVGMEAFFDRNIGELSGGQQQRVFIARAIVSKPEVLILDEPTVGIDNKHVQSFYEMLAHLNKNMGITLLLVTHDIGIVTDKVTHVACLNKYLHFHGSAEQFKDLDENDLSNLYGHGIHLLDHDHEHQHKDQEADV
ncbi:metal ABC transporter ATP-binding protein [Bacillus thermotolerans]|uniref:Zinc ABC transporter, ATP-binding protein ZnuC n=1 Tax=Bacillus thermotolerans TaxID=1221996 RepID=A0A0F5HJ25_BACTR|nr:metal ABC transporter ATP-binding protein [Bacillus thermotolerans]KKB33243.1 Zinc ABC transporter, ATP-binding protein ZnuC [Bacillus thermotolerans]KKB41907.1 Zinc ABC transporter, ATP-binding protein ZnuC [Bacillus thermotolerans]KKB43066.1 Zinc ABC transporter, ATP-binding protein ZnuC [Bacillus thermotolerans]